MPGCLTDFLTRPGPDGYVTVVVSDPAHRPAAAAQEVMAEYYPVARYCDPATILEQGVDACFD